MGQAAGLFARHCAVGDTLENRPKACGQGGVIDAGGQRVDDVVLGHGVRLLGSDQVLR